MNKNWLGFFGSDKYDIILYFSRFLLKLDKKVLVLDLSENKAVSYSIPNPEQLKEVDYRGVVFSTDLNSLDLEKEYDYILIDFGFNANNMLLSDCEKVIYVTDQQVHHIEPLTVFCNSHTLEDSQKEFLIVKDCLSTKVKVEYIAKKLGKQFGENEVFTMFFDETDYGNRLLAQHTYNFKFKGSSDVKAICMALIEHENLSKKALNKAYKRAEGGK